MKKNLSLLLFFLGISGLAYAAYAAGEPQVLHKNGRRDPIDMMGKKLYDSTGTLLVAPFQAQDANSISLGFYGEGRLVTTALVNWNITTLQPLYTCPTGKTCYVHAVRLRTGSGTSGTAVCGVGWDAGATNVIAQSTNALSATNYIRKTVTLATFNASAGSLGFKCGTPEGSAYTSTVDVYGSVE